MQIVVLGDFHGVGYKVVLHCWVHLHYVASLSTHIEIVYHFTFQVWRAGYYGKCVGSGNEKKTNCQALVTIISMTTPQKQINKEAKV